MNCKEFIQYIKEAKLPFHLSDNEEQVVNNNLDQLQSKYLYQFSEKDFYFKKEDKDIFGDSKIFNNSTMKSLGQSPLNRPTKQKNLKQSPFRFFTDEILQDYQIQKFVSRKIKCVSLERVSLEELRFFHKYDYSSRNIKKIV